MERAPGEPETQSRPPDDLASAYREAWDRLLALALDDLAVVEDADSLRSMLGAVALARGDLRLGAWISNADQSEIDEDLERRDSWSEKYR